jgi:hypothetical protein
MVRRSIVISLRLFEEDIMPLRGGRSSDDDFHRLAVRIANIVERTLSAGVGAQTLEKWRR